MQLRGFGSSLAIHRTSEPGLVDPPLNDPRAMKKYSPELQVIGGQANLLAARFQDWFAVQ